MSQAPAAVGPAGALFEGQVGAHYLLTMLAGSEPRGLPGTSIETVQLQCAGDGFPLDDVIIRAREISTGRESTLQIQVKRSITFSPHDTVFKKVVAQIAKAIVVPGFWASRNEIAIATSRGSKAVDGAYQDVLHWSRQLGSSKLFFERLGRRGTASDSMRTFVETLQNNLREVCAPYDTETVWKILARLQILVFDYAAVGSATEELSQERTRSILLPENAGQAPIVWKTLIELAFNIAASAGERDRIALVDDLSKRSVSIAGQRRLVNVRTAIDEMSDHSLRDIIDRIGSTCLARSGRIQEVYDALEVGRYVEIRGDAGVGKSGILKHLADLQRAEGHVVVLSPGRTSPRGWQVMRGQLGFNGTAHDLLRDLASDGGAALFIDNLDSFDVAERSTVNDLLRAAADVPAISVIATARRNFGIDERSWLDADAIKDLKPSAPVIVDELSPDELQELKEAAPQLIPLLRDDHPARDVVRNLYRLSRLSQQHTTAPMPKTELDMAAEWWHSADGLRDAGHRERARALRNIAEKSISGPYIISVREEQSKAVDALVVSNTLRDLGNDNVVFRHDILRQWAIGNLLAVDDDAFFRLPLDKPASAILSRGVELAARFALERESTSTKWMTMLSRSSGAGILDSWRRSVLLALPHSEIADSLFDREAECILANDGELLRELIRTVMAVDVEPALPILIKLGADPSKVPPGFFVPRGVCWLPLLKFMLKRGPLLPSEIIPDIADYYGKWVVGTLGTGSFTLQVLEQFYSWLIELEFEFRPLPPSATSLYSEKLPYDIRNNLRDSIRANFLMFCDKAPTLAQTYLNRVRNYERGNQVVPMIMRFRGAMAQAAPKQLVALTIEALISMPREEESYWSREPSPFHFIDQDFNPPTPTQGPFLDLLKYAPEDGLALIRQLVAHALTVETDRSAPGDDGFLIRSGEDQRFFPWCDTYRWSRGDSRYAAMTSGLMALEEWSHQRVEAGDDFEVIMNDILGPVGTCAAFLLVAVDLAISHPLKSKKSGIPLVTCPELIMADRFRLAQDQINDASASSDYFRASERGMQPQRSSRLASLEWLIGQYACFGPEDIRQELVIQLDLAARRLGVPENDSDFADPRFVTRFALNLADPKNWHEREVYLVDGSTVKAKQYVSPENEAGHLAQLEKVSKDKRSADGVQAALLLAIDNASAPSEDLIERGIAWARSELTGPKAPNVEDEAHHVSFVREESIRAAALLLIRFGSVAQRQQHSEWAEAYLLDGLKAEDDPAHRNRSGLKFNPSAAAFVGIATLYTRETKPQRLRILLEIAAKKSPAGAHGFALIVADLAHINERVPEAIIRCALAASVKPMTRWGVGADEAARGISSYASRIATAIDRELAWIAGEEIEPDWPILQPGLISRRRRRQVLRLPGPGKSSFEFGTESGDYDNRGADSDCGDEDAASLEGEQSAQPVEASAREVRGTFVDEHAIALWLRALTSMPDSSKRPWLLNLARNYADFSAKINGQGLRDDEELSHTPFGWNAAYYTLVSRCIVGLSSDEADELVVDRICGLPDNAFYDVASGFLRAVDVLYFNDNKLKDKAPAIRQRFIQHLLACSGWRRHAGRKSSSVEFHLGPCIGTIMFNEYAFGRTECYLPPSAVDRIGPFLPSLMEFVSTGPSYFVAILTMDLVEISPHLAFLPLLITAVTAWLESYPDDKTFWVDHSIGRRLCTWLERTFENEPHAFVAERPERKKVDHVLGALVRLGIAEARQLEGILAASD